VDILGYEELIWLGYGDSGYPEPEEPPAEGRPGIGVADPAKFPPGSFAAAPFAEAVERLVRILRAQRPQVLIIYSDDQEGYLHPDHVRVHDVGLAAYQACGDPDAFPTAGPPYQPLKLYYSLWARARLAALHEAFVASGLESPYSEWWFDRPWQDHRITTRVEVAAWYHRRCDALRAHASQVDPDSPFWFGLPEDVAAAAYPYADYILAHSEIGEVPELKRAPEDGAPQAGFEEDLFEGIRAEGGADAL